MQDKSSIAVDALMKKTKVRTRSTLWSRHYELLGTRRSWQHPACKVLVLLGRGWRGGFAEADVSQGPDTMGHAAALTAITWRSSADRSSNSFNFELLGVVMRQRNSSWRQILILVLILSLCTVEGSWIRSLMGPSLQPDPRLELEIQRSRFWLFTRKSRSSETIPLVTRSNQAVRFLALLCVQSWQLRVGVKVQVFVAN